MCIIYLLRSDNALNYLYFKNIWSSLLKLSTGAHSSVQPPVLTKPTTSAASPTIDLTAAIPDYPIPRIRPSAADITMILTNICKDGGVLLLHLRTKSPTYPCEAHIHRKYNKVKCLHLISGVLLCQFLWKTILIIVLLQRLNNNGTWGSIDSWNKILTNVPRIEDPMVFQKLNLYLRSEKENAFTASIQSLPGCSLGSKLHNALAWRPSTIIHNHNGPLYHAKLTESFF